MFKSLSNIVLSGKLSQIVPIQLQSLRWKRKPRKPFWLGMAKTKLFRIPEDPVLPIEERKELLRLHANYQTSIKSIRQYLQSCDIKTETSETTIELATAEEIAKSYKNNEEWNAECLKKREERLILKEKQHEMDAIMSIEHKDKMKNELQKRIEEIVRMEKANSKDFITKENLDSKIEECLDSITDYNYAIDLKGNIYTGYEEQMKATERTEDPVEKSAVSS